MFDMTTVKSESSFHLPSPQCIARDFGFTKVKYSSFTPVGSEFVSPFVQEAFEESVTWLKSNGVLTSSKQEKVIRTTKIEFLAARTHPFAKTKDEFRITVDMMIL